MVWVVRSRFVAEEINIFGYDCLQRDVLLFAIVSRYRNRNCAQVETVGASDRDSAVTPGRLRAGRRHAVEEERRQGSTIKLLLCLEAVTSSVFPLSHRCLVLFVIIKDLVVAVEPKPDDDFHPV